MNDELLTLLDKFYAINHYNMALYSEENKLIKLYSSSSFYTKIYPRFLNYKDNEYLTKKEGYIGIYSLIVDKITKNKLIIGPFINKDISLSTLNYIKYEYNLSDVEINDLQKEITSSSFNNYLIFLNLTSFFNYLINKDELNIVDIFINESKNIEPEIKKEEAQNFIKGSYENKYHGTYEVEQLIGKYIENGDIEGLDNYFNYISQNVSFNEGKLAETELRQQKNLFIGLIAVLGKGPLIRGGLSIEEAYNLIDFYTQECEKLTTVEAINNLRYIAVTSFAKKIRSIKKESSYSKDVISAIDFIKANITSNFGVDEVIESLGKKRTSFLNQFKKETSMTLGKYIQKAKLDETKNLLEFTDTSILDISIIFNFSSQAYFQNLFKKEFGVTPLEFRKGKRCNN